MERRLKGKTIILTGDGSNVGEACARRFSEKGANVVLVGLTRSKLYDVAAKLDIRQALVIEPDVSISHPTSSR